jgi:predicted AlkP superfamily pyrophosphatase or phosphodiesterase
MNKIALINVVGLSKRLIGNDTPFLKKWSASKNISSIEPVLPAVTCSVQTTYLTGKWPNEHGIVANGWFFKELQEIKLWKQSNKLVQSESIWDYAKKMNPAFTCANMFWWYNMYSSVDYAVTPRPQYRANGLKIPDCYSAPANLRDRLQQVLGTFPLFDFWGPKTSIKSSKWIADASKLVFDWHRPDLLLVYLPHLDYVLQKSGHEQTPLKKDLLEIDKVCERLILSLEAQGVQVNIISEYGITDVSTPVHINRILREMGMISVRKENGLELLDPGTSKAFALADHQVAHIYINDATQKAFIKEELSNHHGIEWVLDETGQKEHHLDHERSGDLVIVAKKDHWFTYYYWLDDTKAPDYARTVAIHDKPGYDPVEMFLDPNKKLIIPRIALKLIAKKIGFRTLMDIIPLDASLVKGSHGRIQLEDKDKAIFIGHQVNSNALSPTEIKNTLLTQIFGTPK